MMDMSLSGEIWFVLILSTTFLFSLPWPVLSQEIKPRAAFSSGMMLLGTLSGGVQPPSPPPRGARDGEWDGVETPVQLPFRQAPWARGVTCSQMTYWSSGVPVTAFLIRPDVAAGGRRSGRLPLVIANRGGYGRKVGAWDGLSLASLAFLAKEIPAVVIASQYRGGSAPTRNRFDHDGYMGLDLNDVICLDKLAGSLKGVDPDRLGMYGFSRGGAMTFNAWLLMPHVRGVVTVGGLVDFEGWIQYLERLDDAAGERPITIAGQRFLPRQFVEECRQAIATDLWLSARVETPKAMTEAMFRAAIRDRSPGAPARLKALARRGPILLVHGGKDMNNPVEQARTMARRMKAVGAAVSLCIIPDAGHMVMGVGKDDAGLGPEPGLDPKTRTRARQILEERNRRIVGHFRDAVFGAGRKNQRGENDSRNQ
jgi:pimeloyl-ACP methyl ester carboxylesterase